MTVHICTHDDVNDAERTTMEPNEQPTDMDKWPGLTPEKEALRSALELNFRTILEKPITPNTLMQIEQMAALGRRLLAVGKDPRALYSSYGNQLNMGGYASYGVGGAEISGTMEPLPASAPLASSSPAETFGATFIRELVSSISQLAAAHQNHHVPAIPIQPELGLTELIFAIDLARTKELPELARKLEDKLMQRIEAPTTTIDPPTETEPIESKEGVAA